MDLDLLDLAELGIEDDRNGVDMSARAIAARLRDSLARAKFLGTAKDLRPGWSAKKQRGQ